MSIRYSSCCTSEARITSWVNYHINCYDGSVTNDDGLRSVCSAVIANDDDVVIADVAIANDDVIIADDAAIANANAGLASSSACYW